MTDHEVWIDIPEEGFVVGLVQKVLDDGVTLQIVHRDATLCVHKDHTWPYVEPEIPPDDSTELPELDAPSILQNTKRRFLDKKIYTYCGGVLLAVNPYEELPCFSDDVRQQYTKLRQYEHGSLPPHPYAIANTSYCELVKHKRSQAIVISGESGAGKTETARIVMKYLAKVPKIADELGAAQLEKEFLSATPILEAFGNARTIRNNNSSRFGNYKCVAFDQEGRFKGAQTLTYLLESSRVCWHSIHERNFHVFYFLLAGFDDDELARRFHLHPNKKYAALYNEKSSPEKRHPLASQKRFTELCENFTTLGFDAEIQNTIFSVCAAIVHLGEIHLSPTDEEHPDEFTVDNRDALDNVCFTLGLESASDLISILEHHHLHAGRDNVTHTKKRSIEQAQQLIYSMMKILYTRLFHSIVTQINQFSKRDQGTTCHIGILDIYGFETLETNSLEQLLINLANERLLDFFLKNVIVEEQALLCREGLLKDEIEFEGTTPCLTTIRGILNLVDDASQLCSRNATMATDVKMTQSLFEKFGFQHKSRRSSSVGACSIDASSAVSADASPGGSIEASPARSSNASPDGSWKRARTDSVRREGEQRRSSFESFTIREDVTKSRGAYITRPTYSRSNHKTRDDAFVLHHFAGRVEYTTTGWLDKNHDKMYPEFERLLRSSKYSMVHGMALPAQSEHAGERFVSVSKTFCANLDSLHHDLSSVHVHYIRCINPNHNKRAGEFHAKYVRDQLVNCGTVDLLRVMRFSYPLRIPFETVRNKFATALPEFFQHLSDRKFVESILHAYNVHRSGWFLGNRRLFYKPGVLLELEELTENDDSPSDEILAKIKNVIRTRRWRVAKIVLLFTRSLLRKSRAMQLWRSLGHRLRIARRMIKWLHRIRLQKIKCDTASPRRPILNSPTRRRRCSEIQSESNHARESGSETDTSDEEHNHEQRSECDSTDKNSVSSEMEGFALSTPVLVIAINDQRKVTGTKAEDAIVFDGINLHAATIQENGSLDTLRYIDLTQHGQVELQAPQPQDQIVAFCQHPQQPNLLAAVDHEGFFYVFLWLGISEDTSPPLSVLWVGELDPCVKIMNGKHQVFARKIAFHPKYDNQLFALWETHGEFLGHQRHIVTAIERNEQFGSFKVLSSMLLSAPQSGRGYEFSVFEFTQSGDFLILGGRSYLSLFSFNPSETTPWTFQVEEEHHNGCVEVSEGNILCCLPLQHQLVPGGRKSDVVHFGLESGLILTLTVNVAFGRLSFEGKTWNYDCVPVRSLMGVPIRTLAKDATQARCKGIAFRQRLDATKFRCLDDDKISHWVLDKTKWTRKWKEVTRNKDEPVGCNSAAWSHFRAGVAVVMSNWGEDSLKPKFQVRVVQPACCHEA